MKPYLKSISGGMMTTVQDFGRMGHQSQGVPVGGALDPVMLRLANALVGNSEGLGALEIRILGPTFKVAADTIRVALTGTTMPLEILEPKRETVPPYRSVRLERDQVFRIQTVSDTACCYLAVEGGFNVPTIYHSQSTYVFGGFGGFEGRPIREGDHIPLNYTAATPGPDYLVGNTFDQDDGGPIRVVLGPQADYFTEAGISTFLEKRIHGDQRFKPNGTSHRGICHRARPRLQHHIGRHFGRFNPGAGNRAPDHFTRGQADNRRIS